MQHVNCLQFSWQKCKAGLLGAVTGGIGGDPLRRCEGRQGWRGEKER